MTRTEQRINLMQNDFIPWDMTWAIKCLLRAVDVGLSKAFLEVTHHLFFHTSQAQNVLE